MAGNEAIGRLRERLLETARQYDDMAESVLTRLSSS
jgi:hypothetical protein